MPDDANLTTLAIYWKALSFRIALSSWIVTRNIMAINKEITAEAKTECTKKILPVKDALEVLSGRWKLPIIISLGFGNKRFKEITKDVHNITDKVLSKELKELEVNKLITRTVYDTFPPTVEYSITEYGRSLHEVVEALNKWGTSHRKKIMGK